MFEILGRPIHRAIYFTRENSAFSGYFVAAGEGERGEGRTTKVDHGGRGSWEKREGGSVD